MMDLQPPKWADRFLVWYCNPDLLEEIQGDVYELYFERVKNEGKRAADWKYAMDVIRFCRWSNIKRTGNEYRPGTIAALWSFNLKLAARNASKNKLIFVIKTTGLAICLAFTILLSAFVVHELTFDQFHTNHERIYRVVSKVDFQDRITNYAVTPLPLGPALLEGIPEIENYFRFMYEDKPIFLIGETSFYNEVTLAADSNFMKILTFDFIQGNNRALDSPDKIVITETLAEKFFGSEDPLGRTIEFGNGSLLEVTAVIRDVPSNSHLKFDALISWDTFDRQDEWGNLNAYTYILLKPNVTIAEVQKKVPSVLATFHSLITREYTAAYEPVFENISAIHFSKNLDEEVAEKRNKSNLFILLAVVILFFITGLINYLNLTLAELTTNLKKIGIIRVFGGTVGSHHKILFSDTLFTVLIVAPMVLLFCYGGWEIGRSYLSIHINPDAIISPVLITMLVVFLMLLFAAARVNSFVLSKASHVINALKGKLTSRGTGTGMRKILVAVQLSFSVIMIALITIIVDQFHFIQRSDKGFDDTNTIVIKLRSDEPSGIETFNEELRKLPGISKVDASSYYPGVLETKYVFQVETEKGREQVLVPMIRCGYDYMDVLNVKVADGRAFDANRVEDRHTSFIVNEAAAREFGWKDAIGKQIRGPINGSDEAHHEGEVIGVVRDFNFASLHNKIEPLIIFLSDENWGSRFIYVKLEPIHHDNVMATIETKFKTLWPENPFEWEYLDTGYLTLYKKDYEVKTFFEIGLAISVIVSCMGIFSISALLVTLRTKEMGIRKVVGANSLQLFILHVKSFLQFSLISILLAWPVIWYLADKWLQNFAYHINMNIWYFIFPGITALMITLIITCYHGIKSSRVNLAATLKHE